MCELKWEGWEDHLNVTPVLKIARTKKSCTKISLPEGDISKRLDDGRLSGSCEAVKPEHTFALFVLQPPFEL